VHFFADGHAEIHKWRDGRTGPPAQYNCDLKLNVASPNNQTCSGWPTARAR